MRSLNDEKNTSCRKEQQKRKTLEKYLNIINFETVRNKEKAVIITNHSTLN